MVIFEQKEMMGDVNFVRYFGGEWRGGSIDEISNGLEQS